MDTLRISLLDIVLRCLVGGIMANLEEERFYHLNPDLPLAPTLFSFFGLVNIQVRGKLIEAGELAKCPFRQHAQVFHDLECVKNFAWVSGRICLIDYGFSKLNILLGQTSVAEATLVNTIMGARHL